MTSSAVRSHSAVGILANTLLAACGLGLLVPASLFINSTERLIRNDGTYVRWDGAPGAAATLEYGLIHSVKGNLLPVIFDFMKESMFETSFTL